MGNLSAYTKHICFTNMAGIAGREYEGRWEIDTPEVVTDRVLEYKMFHEPDYLAAAKEIDEQYLVSAVEGNEYNLLRGKYPIPGFEGFTRDQKRLIFKVVECLCEKLRGETC